MEMSETWKDIRPGTVVDYEPDPSRHDPRWCREGTAIATQYPGRPLIFLDTYWGGGGDQHVLDEAERATITPIFHLEDYDELNGRGSRNEWITYAPDDRQRITSQHGLQARYFVLKGARPSLETKIENAREKVEQAKEELAAATRWLGYMERDLAELENQREQVASDQEQR